MRVDVMAASREDLMAACRMLATARPGPLQDSAAARYHDLFNSGEFDPAGVFVARDGSDKLLGTMLVQVLPGALGLAWPPRAVDAPDRCGIEDRLAAAACHWLRSRGVKVCQVFGIGEGREELGALARHGFQYITEVTHLRRDVDRGRDAFDPAASPLQFEPLDPHHREPIASTLLATYENTQDCPELTGSRTNEDLLSGFCGLVASYPKWWFLARHNGGPVGVVLLEVGTEPGALELNYLGLVPAVRGRGWSSSMVRFAIGFAAAEGTSAVTLSVDIRNEPALRLYARHGFREYERRKVFLASWPP
jgi:ribosomal protein S18 acetylase RimI-like enzyme